MRRAIAPVLLGLLGGCYLFSDEPKARKPAESGAAEAGAEGPADPGAEGSGAQAKAEAGPELPGVEDEARDCPELLTGVETAARSVASSCGPVRIRGQYRVEGGSLTLEAGVELRFEPGAVLEVGRDQPGQLHVRGSAEQPVRMVPDSVSESGGWQGLRLHAGASGSSLSQVEIVGGGTSERAALWIAAEQVELDQLRVGGAPGLALELVEGARVALLGAELGGGGVVARSTPAALAGLQELKLEPGAVVSVAPGIIAETLEWPPNRYRVEGVVEVRGTPERPAQLSLAAGTELRFAPTARVLVGGLGPGIFSASAAAPVEAPELPVAPSPELTPAPGLPDGRIVLRADEDQRPGSWSGLHIQDQGQLSLRYVELAHGGARDEGVIVAEAHARLALQGCTLRDNLVGVELRGVELELERLDDNRFEGTPVAVRSSPALLGALGPNNHYDELAQIHVERGKVEADASWTAQAAPLIIHGDVFVDRGATLVVAPGTRLGFDPGVVLGVGYYERATLDMRGTAEAPILLEPAAAEPQAQPWGGVVLGAHASKCRFEHLRLRGTGNAAGVELRDSADATLVEVDCAGCVGATVKWDCESSVGNIGVTGSAGTPTPMLAPSGCK